MKRKTRRTKYRRLKKWRRRSRKYGGDAVATTTVYTDNPNSSVNESQAGAIATAQSMNNMIAQ